MLFSDEFLPFRAGKMYEPLTCFFFLINFAYGKDFSKNDAG